VLASGTDCSQQDCSTVRIAAPPRPGSLGRRPRPGRQLRSRPEPRSRRPRATTQPPASPNHPAARVAHVGPRPSPDRPCEACRRGSPGPAKLFVTEAGQFPATTGVAPRRRSEPCSAGPSAAEQAAGLRFADPGRHLRSLAYASQPLSREPSNLSSSVRVIGQSAAVDAASYRADWFLHGDAVFRP